MVVVDEVVALSLEFLVGCQSELYDQVSCVLGESDIALTGESDFFGTWLSTRAWFNFDDPGDRDDSLVPSVIDSLNLVELNLFLASEEELFESAGHGNLKVLGGIRLGDAGVLRDELQSRDLIAKGIKGNREWVASTEELLKNLIDVTGESVAALDHRGLLLGGFLKRDLRGHPGLEHLLTITVKYVAELSIREDLVGLADLCKSCIRLSDLLRLLSLRVVCESEDAELFRDLGHWGRRRHPENSVVIFSHLNS